MDEEDGADKLSNGQTMDEWLEERKKTNRMLQVIDRDEEKLERSFKGRVRKRWHNKAQARAMKDPIYAEIRSRLPGNDRYGRKDIHILIESTKRWHEIIKRPWYMKVLGRHDDWVIWRRRQWHTFRFQKLHIRTDSPFWHQMHNGDWACPDCDSLFDCRSQDDDPEHLCTAAIIDIDMAHLDEMDDDGKPWSMKAICWKCGYTGKMAQRRERKKLRRRGARV